MDLKNIDFDLVFDKATKQETSFSEKKEFLFEVGKKLKKDFIGIDSVIDRIMESILPWYLMPDAMRRPHIICLWGMTGVGKTDLVRKLVKYMNYSDRFLEIQMTNTGSSSTSVFESIQDSIEYSNLSAGTPGVLFLDEIQRYRTIDEGGRGIHDVKRQDIWQLLSDGKFSVTTRQKDLVELLYADLMYDWGARSFGRPNHDEDLDEYEGDLKSRIKSKAKRRSKATKEEAPSQQPEVFKPIFNRGYTTAKKIKKLLKSPESVKEIMMWDDFKKEENIRAALKDLDIFVGDDYSKLLIVISGNLDEAYAMAKDVGSADVDADLMHDFSKRINFITIKESLLRRFTPEQIARFGNNHIIYPSLNREAFENVIDKSLNEIKTYVKSKHAVSLEFDREVVNFIYRNGVFPAQGVRPVFSTISGTVEGVVPEILIYSKENSSFKDFALSYSEESSSFMIKDKLTNKLLFTKKVVGDLDKIKGGSTLDFLTTITVHEMGHALVYAKLFGYAPPQIELNSSSYAMNGYIGRHHIFRNESNFKKEIAVCYGGLVAEKLVFGEHSRGVQVDVETATNLAGNMVKVLSMGGGFSAKFAMEPPEDMEYLISSQDFPQDVKLIENILHEAEDSATQILKEYVELLASLVEFGLKYKKMQPEQFMDICNRHNLPVKLLKADATIIPENNKIFKEFLAKVTRESYKPSSSK